MSFSKILVLAMALMHFPAQATSPQDEASLPYMPPDAIDGPWQVVDTKAPRYPRSAAVQREDGCAVVGFIIESDGATSGHSGIVSYPSDRFIEPALKAVQEFSYAPSASNPERTPVYTTQVFTFQMGRSKETDVKVREALGDICSSAAQRLLGVGISEPTGTGKTDAGATADGR